MKSQLVTAILVWVCLCVIDIRSTFGVWVCARDHVSWCIGAHGFLNAASGFLSAGGSARSAESTVRDEALSNAGFCSTLICSWPDSVCVCVCVWGERLVLSQHKHKIEYVTINIAHQKKKQQQKQSPRAITASWFSCYSSSGFHFVPALHISEQAEWWLGKYLQRLMSSCFGLINNADYLHA